MVISKTDKFRPNNTFCRFCIKRQPLLKGDSKMKKTFFTEAAYLIGIVILAIGTAFMERADFGMSMVVAPAYILHLKISEYFSFFTFGMAEYALQAVLIILLSLINRKIKRAYLFSFGTAVLYGLILDRAISAIALIPYNAVVFRGLCFGGGMLMCAAGVALLFNTYISPEAYELFVKEIAAKSNIPINRVKTAYDCSSFAVSVIMSFALFGLGRFEGIKFGTVINALLNGWLIGKASLLFGRVFEFRDGLPLRKYFEK